MGESAFKARAEKAEKRNELLSKATKRAGK
jgi:hypothetical protein